MCGDEAKIRSCFGLSNGFDHGEIEFFFQNIMMQFWRLTMSAGQEIEWRYLICLNFENGSLARTGFEEISTYTVPKLD
jgi:hypothetical protein